MVVNNVVFFNYREESVNKSRDFPAFCFCDKAFGRC